MGGGTGGRKPERHGARRVRKQEAVRGRPRAFAAQTNGGAPAEAAGSKLIAVDQAQSPGASAPGAGAASSRKRGRPAVPRAPLLRAAAWGLPSLLPRRLRSVRGARAGGRGTCSRSGGAGRVIRRRGGVLVQRGGRNGLDCVVLVYHLVYPTYDDLAPVLRVTGGGERGDR